MSCDAWIETLSARLDGDCLRVRVSNTWKITAQEGTTRIGLANARERLRLLYGSAAALVIENDGAERVRANISIPVGAEPVGEGKG